MQERRNSSANALELRLSWTNPSIYLHLFREQWSVHAQSHPVLIPRACCLILKTYIDGLVQERCNSIANALELHLSCANPLIYLHLFTWQWSIHAQLHLALIPRVCCLILRYISMGWCKKDVTPLLMHWSYVFLVLTHWCIYIYLEDSEVCLSNSIQSDSP